MSDELERLRAERAELVDWMARKDADVDPWAAPPEPVREFARDVLQRRREVARIEADQEQTDDLPSLAERVEVLAGPEAAARAVEIRKALAMVVDNLGLGITDEDADTLVAVLASINRERPAGQAVSDD